MQLPVNSDSASHCEQSEAISKDGIAEPVPSTRLPRPFGARNDIRGISLPRNDTIVRVGCVRYLNTLPFYHGLEQKTDHCQIVFEKASPTELNRLMREDKLDISLVSSLEYARGSSRYLLLPSFCIGARKFSESVLLISKVPLAGLNGKRIMLSEESLSSQVLLKILLAKMKTKVVFETASQNPLAMLARGDACLLIGDGALFFDLPKSYYRYDLGQLWNELTGLPFCFAVWAVRREFARENPEAVREFLSVLRKNFQANMEVPAPMIRFSQGLPQKGLADYDKCFKYLSDLHFELDETLEKALIRYFELAKEIGELERVPELEYFE
jgi:chorismate dehydratase